MCDFKDIKNLAYATRTEQKNFLDSFDHVLSDLDGVVWVGFNPLLGSADCLNNLRDLGKSVSFVSNNGTLSARGIYKLLRKCDVIVEEEDIVNPVNGYITVLRGLNFNKTIFVIGQEELRKELKKAGFKVALDHPHPINDSISEIAKHLVDNEEVGAVIVDYDINLTHLQLLKALTYLKRNECHFITGAGDRLVPFPIFGPLIGNHYFFEALKDLSGRKPCQMAKPSLEFSKYVNAKLGITNPKRVLFIGDSIKEDMKFATLNGFKKLLVLSGVTKKEHLLDWTEEEKLKPDYYIDSLDTFYELIQKLRIK